MFDEHLQVITTLLADVERAPPGGDYDLTPSRLLLATRPYSVNQKSTESSAQIDIDTTLRCPSRTRSTIHEPIGTPAHILSRRSVWRTPATPLGDEERRASGELLDRLARPTDLEHARQGWWRSLSSSRASSMA